MSNESLSKIKTVVSNDYSSKEIKSLYNSFFAKSPAPNFFLSQIWIENWLNCAQSTPELVKFYEQERLVGFAFIGVQHTFFGKVFYLNQCGNQQDDQIWIEYNDVICAEQHEACRQSLLHYIASQKGVFQFVCINAEFDAWTHPKWRLWSKDPAPGFLTQLNTDALSTVFSKNTKSQINRSRNFIEKELGPIQFEQVAKEEIDSALFDMANLHIKQWGEHDYGSGFSNPRFMNFHKNLIQQGYASFAQVLKFSAGKNNLGYLYYLIQGNYVYFYLSAINYCIKSNKFKPGLVMHKLAMEHFQSLNFEVYDFLAGDARYKHSLSNKKYTLLNIKLYTNVWYYWPIKVLINLKRRAFKLLNK